MLHTAALALGNEAVSNMALTHLKDITPLITEISKITPQVVARELEGQATIVNANAGIQATQNTQEAWEPQHVNQAVL